MELAFAQPGNDVERRIKDLIDQFNAQESARLEQQLFKQRKRLADAERSLRAKATKAAAESQRIASDKVAWLLGKLADLRRTEARVEDARIFPGHYAPVIVIEQTGALDAFGRSRALVRGHGWTVFGIVLVTGLLSGIATTLLQEAFSFLPRFLEILIGSTIAQAVVAPFTAIAIAITYFRLREAHAATAAPVEA